MVVCFGGKEAVRASIIVSFLSGVESFANGELFPAKLSEERLCAGVFRVDRVKGGPVNVPERGVCP